MRKGATVEKAVCIMNATAPATERTATRTFESQRPLLNRDGARVSQGTVSTTTCSLWTHIKWYGRTALTNYITEPVQKTSKSSDTLSIPLQIVLKGAESGYVWKSTNLTLDNYDAETKIFETISICGINCKVHLRIGTLDRQKQIDLVLSFLTEKINHGNFHTCNSCFIWR